MRVKNKLYSHNDDVVVGLLAIVVYQINYTYTFTWYSQYIVDITANQLLDIEILATTQKLLNKNQFIHEQIVKQ